MGRFPRSIERATRQHLLQAALVSFARRGYAATSVQEIVDAAKVSKPALYYYFHDKAHLFQALVDTAHDERLRLMQAAAAKGATIAEKLEHIVADVFQWSLKNRELMRLAFATAFAASGDTPGLKQCRIKGRRNYEFVRSLIEQGQAAGELDRYYSADDLAMGVYGQLNIYVLVRLVAPDCPLDRQAARTIVRLFLNGAGAWAKGKRSVAGREGSADPGRPTPARRGARAKAARRKR